MAAVALDPLFRLPFRLATVELRNLDYTPLQEMTRERMSDLALATARIPRILKLLSRRDFETYTRM